MIIAHRAGLRIVEVPVRDARAPGRPLVDHAAALRVLHGQGAHGGRACRCCAVPSSFRTGRDPRHPRLADRRDRAAAVRARARAPAAAAGALLSALAGHRADPRSSSPPGPPCSRASPAPSASPPRRTRSSSSRSASSSPSCCTSRSSSPGSASTPAGSPSGSPCSRSGSGPSRAMPIASSTARTAADVDSQRPRDQHGRADAGRQRDADAVDDGAHAAEHVAARVAEGEVADHAVDCPKTASFAGPLCVTTRRRARARSGTSQAISALSR